MPTDDYIKRSDAIKALYQGYEKLGLIVHRVSCIEKINKIPAADVEPVRHGRWKEYQTMAGYYLECSCCGVKSNMDHMLYAYRYCQYCGAKMNMGEV